MLVKTIILFLGAMAILGLIGKALFPGAITRAMKKRVGPPVCKSCGRYVLARSGCDCGKKG